MRVAALYDIHGNLPALEAVLAEIRTLTVERVVVGGDVLPGPMARECLDCLRALDIPTSCLRGNGDRVVLDLTQGHEPSEVPPPYRDAIRWSAEQLTSDHEAWLARWPETLRIVLDGIGDVLFCHATPRNDWEIFTSLTPAEQLLPIFSVTTAALVICGHSHMQFDRNIGGARVVNAGSVGMPFGAAGADWLLLGPDVQLRHTSYDLEAAAEQIRRTQYPQASDFAERYVLHPPSAEAMLEVFTLASLKPRPSY